MIVLKVTYVIICVTVLFFLVLPFFTVILSLLKKEKIRQGAGQKHDFACIITAYKNIDMSLPLIDSLLSQDYKDYFIYLVADDCDTSKIDFDHPNVVLLHPEKKLSSKVKSMLHAVANFKRKHSAIVIFDPDNLATPNFLSLLNDYLNAGFSAVQGKRTAKNLDTIYACADATGEIYKNYVERYVPYLLGSSPTIAGSGMAVKTELFKEFLNNNRITESLKHGRVIPAEDKILQNDLVGKKFQIAFANEAIIFDEKISSAGQVERQRSRWLYSYFENFPNTFRFILKGLKNRNVNQLLFGLITMSPPLFLLLLTSITLCALSYFVSPLLFISFLVGITIFIGNIFIALLLSKAPMKIWMSVWGIPFFIFNQALGLCKMARSRNDFLHTSHNRKVSLKDVMSMEKS